MSLLRALAPSSGLVVLPQGCSGSHVLISLPARSALSCLLGGVRTRRGASQWLEVSAAAWGASAPRLHPRF